MANPGRDITRRRVLHTGGGTVLVGLLGGLGANGVGSGPDQTTAQQVDDPVQEVELVASDGTVESVTEGPSETWLYDDQFPGPELRVSEGDTIRVTVDNQLPGETTVHWHGVPVPNPMDGVPNVTQEPIASGETFSYEYEASPAGTYVYHSHVGLQLDMALNGPLIVEEESPHIEYDREYTLLVDDFLAGRPTLDSIEAPPGGGPGGGGPGPGGGGPGRGPGGGGPGPGGGGPGRGPGGGGPGPGGGGPGRGPGGGGLGPGGGGPNGPGQHPMLGQRPPYEGLVINGRPPSDPPVFDVEEGERVRLRIINPSGTTTYRIGIGGHPFAVTHADGRPVDPVEVDSLVIGMGERYDVVVEADNPGEWSLVAHPVVGNEAPAEARLRYEGTTGTGAADGPRFDGRTLRYSDLDALDPLAVDGTPDRTFDFTLSGGMMQDPEAWLIDGQAYPDADPVQISEGEHIRVRMVNRSPAIHPMHLHGHFFQVGDAVKDTVRVSPHGGQLAFDFRADNPGDWLFHCHNNYHLERGMARVFEYV